MPLLYTVDDSCHIGILGEGVKHTMAKFHSDTSVCYEVISEKNMSSNSLKRIVVYTMEEEEAERGRRATRITRWLAGRREV